MDRISRLDEKQSTALKQFKKAIADCKLVDDHDEYIVKWLIVQNFDVDKAEKMLRKSLEWRLVNRIDDIVGHWQPPLVLTKYYPMGIIGNDKFSCPVWIHAFGRTDWKGILKSVSKKDYLRYVSYLAETNMVRMKQNRLETGHSVTRQTFIIDMDGLSLSQMAYRPVREVGIEAAQISELNYPEQLRRVFVINAPKVFTMAFAMVRPFLHPGSTDDKLRVFGTDPTVWSAALLEEIDADQLPVHYGGTMTDPDGNPRCLHKINEGGQVPETYYIAHNQQKPTPTNNMTSLKVPRGSRNKLEYHVEESNSILSWEYMTEDGDLGFEVYYLDGDGRKAQIVPYERAESHLMMQEGEIVCATSSTYVIEFDNSYSLFRSKNVWHHIQVTQAASSS